MFTGVGANQQVDELKTYAAAEVARQLAGESLKNPEIWILRQIRAGRIPAFKVGREWRMTDADVQAAIDSLRSPKPRALAVVGKPSARSMRRRRA